MNRNINNPLTLSRSQRDESNRFFQYLDVKKRCSLVRFSNELKRYNRVIGYRGGLFGCLKTASTSNFHSWVYNYLSVKSIGSFSGRRVRWGSEGEGKMGRSSLLKKL